MKHLIRFINYCYIAFKKRLGRLSVPLVMLLMVPSLVNAAGPFDEFLGNVRHKFNNVVAPAVRTGMSLIPVGTWHMVELPLASGASCGNGSPYRFYVNRSPFSDNMVVAYEGGGGCSDQKSCNKDAWDLPPNPTPYQKLERSVSATNPGGLSKNYLWLLPKDSLSLGGRVTPFTARLVAPDQQTQTQDWDMVFLPYCTGDGHLGSNKLLFAEDKSIEPRLQYFAGLNNVRVASEWIRDNFGTSKGRYQPKDLLLTGFSAGSMGSTGTYPVVRNTLQPTGKSALVADSGILTSSPVDGSLNDYPSLLANKLHFKAWGLNGSDGLITKYYAGMKGFIPANPGSIYAALSKTYPNDRFGILHFSLDRTIPLFFYLKAYPEHKDMDKDGITASAEAKFLKDLNTWRKELIDPLPKNIGYYHPMYRDFLHSHCLTIIGFWQTGIEELGIPSVQHFIRNVLAHNGSVAVNRQVEVSDADRTRDFITPLIKDFVDYVNALGLALN